MPTACAAQRDNRLRSFTSRCPPPHPQLQILHHACRTGCLRMVQLLLSRGAVASCCDDGGKTPLHDAAWVCGGISCFCSSGTERGHTDGDAEAPTFGVDAGGVVSQRWGIARALLDANVSLLLARDRLRATPLDYVPAKHIPAWKSFLSTYISQRWPALGTGTAHPSLPGVRTATSRLVNN